MEDRKVFTQKRKNSFKKHMSKKNNLTEISVCTLNIKDVWVRLCSCLIDLNAFRLKIFIKFNWIKMFWADS